jgi:hypothetical protein
MTITPMKRVIFGLPGTECSTNFLMQWSDTILELTKQGYSIGISTGLIARGRSAHLRTLGTNPLRGKDQKPFDGKMEYDVWVHIEPNAIFTPKQLIELIEDTDKYPVISGVYRIGDTTPRLSFMYELDDEFFKKNGTYEYAHADSVDPNKKHIPVKHTDLGFFACTREVLEKLEYPYFHHPPVEIPIEDDTTLMHIPTDHEAFCMNINSAGYKIYVNTDLRIGNEIKLII